MSVPTSDEFFTLEEVQEFLCANCQTLLPSASLYAQRKIRLKTWHKAVPEPEEVVHIVFEKYWSGLRRMRKTVVPLTQVYLAIESVLSNLATNSENRRNVPLVSPGAEARAESRSEADVEDERTHSPADDFVNREEGERLLGLLQGNDLDHRVLEFILDRSETSSHEFKHAVRPRAIADELRVSRQDVYRSLERMRKVFESLPSHFPNRSRINNGRYRPHFLERFKAS